MDRQSIRITSLVGFALLTCTALPGWAGTFSLQRIPAAAPSPNVATNSNAAPNSNGEGKTFDDVFQLALTRAETVNIQDEILAQADELDWQAKGALLPTISGSATYLRQQTVSDSVGNALFPAQQNTVKLTADQPIFRGFRDFAALRQRKDLFTSQKAALQYAAQQLFYNTATAYYNVLAFESDEFNYRNEIEINRKRLTELEGFVRIGRSQITDVLTQKSTISSLEATLESTLSQLENAKDVLAFFSGQDRNMPLHDTVTPPVRPEAVALYLERIEQRPDVKSALDSLKANEEGIPIAWGQHLPSVDLVGDYYVARPGSLAGSDWDFELAITMPIFSGGVIVSQTRQAASVARQYSLLLSQARRTAEEEIRQFYDNFLYDERQMTKLDETADLARKNYEALIKEYRNGLVTNLDVLQAITTWQDAIRLYAHQQFTARSDYLKLQASSAQRKEVFVESARVH